MEFLLPDLGEDAGKSAKVTFWYANVGDTVKEGDDVVEMMTDKATFNVPAPVSGRLAEILAAEDDSVEVGGVLGIIEAE